ncbi:hypothetical protein EV360DRAFT_81639 [Lentinula raphanica]|nr:hypothetical protein EV360DRAFT_81639 [Lentinula raphanica]
MALTFVPRFTLPDINSGMEYVFVVDRSGRLPTYETTFDAISFDSKTTKSWDQSRQYSQTTLEEATKHVDTIAWDVSTCVSYIETALSTLPQPNQSKFPKDPSSPFIHVFTVGICDRASSDTCDSNVSREKSPTRTRTSQPSTTTTVTTKTKGGSSNITRIGKRVTEHITASTSQLHRPPSPLKSSIVASPESGIFPSLNSHSTVLYAALYSLRTAPYILNLTPIHLPHNDSSAENVLRLTVALKDIALGVPVLF